MSDEFSIKYCYEDIHKIHNSISNYKHRLLVFVAIYGISH